VKRAYKIKNQGLREDMIIELTGIFKMANAIAKGKVKTQTVDGKPVRYTMKQREKWARVAVYTAQIIDSILKNIDGREVGLMLSQAERLIREAKQMAEAKRPAGAVGKEVTILQNTCAANGLDECLGYMKKNRVVYLKKFWVRPE
jgi:hypothetical protein